VIKVDKFSLNFNLDSLSIQAWIGYLDGHGVVQVFDLGTLIERRHRNLVALGVPELFGNVNESRSIDACVSSPFSLKVTIVSIEIHHLNFALGTLDVGSSKNLDFIYL
jgi:hypothetical protein